MYPSEGLVVFDYNAPRYCRASKGIREQSPQHPSLSLRFLRRTVRIVRIMRTVGIVRMMRTVGIVRIMETVGIVRIVRIVSMVA